MIKYKVKARMAKDIGTDNFSLEEFERVFEDKENPVKARKRAYHYYESVVDIINEKSKIESETNNTSTVKKKEEPKTEETEDQSELKFLDLAIRAFSHRTQVGIYAISDVKEELFEVDEENIIIGHNHLTEDLILADNLEEEISLYTKYDWDTENWTKKIKYWDYEGTYDDIYEPIVLFTPFDFWEHWNPEMAKAKDGVEEEIEEDNLLDKIISSGENRNLEFKSSLRYCYNQKSAQKYIEAEITKTIAAFANTEGGTLIVGVDDDGMVLGLDNDFQTFKGNTKDKFLKHFANLIGAGFSEPIDALIKYGLEVSHRKNIFIVNVEKSSRPRFIKNKKGDKEFYIRRSATSQKLNIEEAVKYVIDKWYTK